MQYLLHTGKNNDQIMIMYANKGLKNTPIYILNLNLF